MIQIQSLSIGYKNGNKVIRRIADDLTMTLEVGQLVLLIGPNGSGKSTLIRTLCGFHKALSGDIIIDGNNIKTLDDKQISRRISVVQSNAPIVQNFTVRDMVSFGRYPYSNMVGSIKEEDYKLVDEAIKVLCIEDLKNSMFDMISDGEKQKTMIAKALAQSTSYIIMDEPMAFLDYQSRLEMMDMLVMMVKQQRKGILLSTHNLEMAIRVADLLWIFDKDSNFVSITPNELFDSGVVEKLFDKRTAEYLMGKDTSR